MKKLFLFLMLVPFALQADPTATSGSQSGAISGAASQAGAVGMIDQSYNKVEAEKRQAPGVFGAGVASGTNPCVVSLSGGLSIPGGAFNLGSAFEDGECTVRESLRLMAAISAGNEPANQIMLREVACQSQVYWDAMERTFIETQDDRYLCGNPRPDTGILPLRDRNNPETPATAEVSREDSGMAHNDWYWDEFGG